MVHVGFHFRDAALFGLLDEDIPTLVPSSLPNDDQTIATKKIPTDDIRTGPITRARAKLLE
jgi:hypothetical protein